MAVKFLYLPDVVNHLHKQTVLNHILYTVICRATTKKAIQRDMLRNIIDKSKLNRQKYSSKPQEGRKSETKEEKTKGTNRKKNKWLT